MLAAGPARAPAAAPIRRLDASWGAGRERGWRGRDPYDALNARAPGPLRRTPLGAPPGDPGGRSARRVDLRGPLGVAAEVENATRDRPRPRAPTRGWTPSSASIRAGVGARVGDRAASSCAPLHGLPRSPAGATTSTSRPASSSTRPRPRTRSRPRSPATRCSTRTSTSAATGALDAAPTEPASSSSSGSALTEAARRRPTSATSPATGPRSTTRACSPPAVLARLARDRRPRRTSRVAAAEARSASRSPTSAPTAPGPTRRARWATGSTTSTPATSSTRCCAALAPLDRRRAPSAAWRRGLRFYRERLFDPDGTPRFIDRLALPDRRPERRPGDRDASPLGCRARPGAARATRGASSTSRVDQMRRADGAFVFQRHRRSSTGSPHVRWVEAPMLSALGPARSRPSGAAAAAARWADEGLDRSLQLAPPARSSRRSPGGSRSGGGGRGHRPRPRPDGRADRASAGREADADRRARARRGRLAQGAGARRPGRGARALGARATAPTSPSPTTPTPRSSPPARSASRW